MRNSLKFCQSTKWLQITCIPGTAKCDGEDPSLENNQKTKSTLKFDIFTLQVVILTGYAEYQKSNQLISGCWEAADGQAWWGMVWGIERQECFSKGYKGSGECAVWGILGDSEGVKDLIVLWEVPAGLDTLRESVYVPVWEDDGWGVKEIEADQVDGECEGGGGSERINKYWKRTKNTTKTLGVEAGELGMDESCIDPGGSSSETWDMLVTIFRSMRCAENPVPICTLYTSRSSILKSF